MADKGMRVVTPAVSLTLDRHVSGAKPDRVFPASSTAPWRCRSHPPVVCALIQSIAYVRSVGGR